MFKLFNGCKATNCLFIIKNYKKYDGTFQFVDFFA